MYYIRRIASAMFLAFGLTTTFFAIMSIFHSSSPTLQKVTAIFVIFTAWTFMVLISIEIMRRRDK